MDFCQFTISDTQFKCYDEIQTCTATVDVPVQCCPSIQPATINTCTFEIQCSPRIRNHFGTDPFDFYKRMILLFVTFINGLLCTFNGNAKSFRPHYGVLSLDASTSFIGIRCPDVKISMTRFVLYLIHEIELLAIVLRYELTIGEVFGRAFLLKLHQRQESMANLSYSPPLVTCVKVLPYFVLALRLGRELQIGFVCVYSIGMVKYVK